MAATIRNRQLARQVSIVGAGMSQFGAFKEKTSRDLFVDAFHDMTDHLDQGIDVEDIECGYIGNYSADLFEGQGHTAPIIADWLGMTPTPITRIENACASSGSALREGIMAIASGLYDVVMVGGVEKMTSLPTEGVTDALATAADGLYEVPAGLTFPGIYRGAGQGSHGPIRNQPQSSAQGGNQKPQQRRIEPQGPIQFHHPVVDGASYGPRRAARRTGARLPR